jgi:nicotinate-nucleotide pyrophosphorylase (carboxylating)
MSGASTCLPDILIEPVIRAALLEDLGRAGDITTDAIVPATLGASAEIVAREPGTVAGVRAAELAFRLLDPAMRADVLVADGTAVAPGDVVMRLSGSARALLSAERVALNILCRLSGIASATSQLVAAVEGHGVAITCTRKTTPGLRALEKAAVRAGGGANHRFGLDDAVLIKDNHIALAGGVAAAIERARRSVGHLVKIEVEVDTLEQLAEAMGGSPDAVLLDNMTPAQLKDAVAVVDRRAITEASGRITLASAAAVAATGVDLISVGWLTHSAKSLDLALDIAPG